MCKDCGCSLPKDENKEHNHHHEHTHHEHLHDNPQLNDKKTISVITKILEKNDHEASHNREHFNSKKILAINLMSSPGSGKTTLLESIKEIANFKYSVIEGDLETNYDAKRLIDKGIEAHQITTGTACHLDAFMVHKALHHLNLENNQVVFIENVGNLVCPASYDLGQHLNIVLLSTPEGVDKVAKYPVMFRSADLILITKSDLKQFFDFDSEIVKADARRLNPKVDILEISSKDDESLKRFCDYISLRLSLR
ncbi:MAG: hydrogenase nickel incorporation protein HypB [Campylobacterales bacterium]|nr:hydrogenase nickel incorporation protein HypB [Campylobacterales bacterium]